MKLTIINESKSKLSLHFIRKWMQFLDLELKRLKVRKAQRLQSSHVTIVFMMSAKAKKLNSQYRGRKYATDILSFDGDGRTELGDLVLCLPVLRRQAKEHGLTLNQETAYMLTHGVLHLLGYDHELSKKESEIMLSLQDKVFAKGVSALKKFVI